MGEEIRTVFWQNGAVVMIDQRALPLLERYVTCTDYPEVIAAIKDLTIRGAPAIGVAAAMGIALGVLHLPDSSPEAFRRAFNEICKQFAATRPTARNLFWAIERMNRCFDETAGSFRPIREALIAEAIRIGEEDIAINRRLGENGRVLIPDGARILTHCNAGALATAG
jgi:methylthioribose-1-phosphate isomerase